MSRSQLARLCIVSLAIGVYGPLAFGQAHTGRVWAIGASVGGPSTVVLLEAGEKQTHVRTSRALIQQALLPALMTGAKTVTVDLEPGSSVIQRVEAYAIAHPPMPGPFYGEYYVSRIATQRKEDGTAEHLEVFLKKNDVETTYNIYEPLLQQLFIAAFQGGRIPVKVDVTFDVANNISTVHLGEKFSD